MSLRKYLITMLLTTLVCWVAFATVLFKIDPHAGGTIGFTLFYIALFFALWGTLSLLGFLVRYFLKRQVVPYMHIGISLRQAFWFATIIVLSLILVAEELFVWWMGLILITGCTVLEGFFLARTLAVKHHTPLSRRKSVQTTIKSRS